MNMRTSVFPMTLFLLVTALAIAPSCQSVLSLSSPSAWNLGSGFQLTESSNGLRIAREQQTIWSAALPFISASAGNDSVIESSGAFRITQVDKNTCQSQTITDVQNVPWQETVTGSAVRLSGSVSGCGSVTVPYTLTFWVPETLANRVAFYIDISSSSNHGQPLKKLYLRFDSNSGEDFYGLGAQASFASLKGQAIPVFSREQGVGRGDEPLTKYENSNGTFSGGNHVTTYTAIPSYISTDANIFYLSTKSTAYANFDFTEDDAVTVRYDSLSVDGMFARASNMFDAVEMLTAYTGRMPALPSWVDKGAVLGIQGGQSKVNRIVEHGLSLDCPIAAVWLQDWCGTRKLSHHITLLRSQLKVMQIRRRGLISTYQDCGGIGRMMKSSILPGTSLCKTFASSTTCVHCHTLTPSWPMFLQSRTVSDVISTMKPML